MSKSLRRVALSVAAVGVLLVAASAWLSSRATTARVDSGPVGERIVARAAVVPSDGVIHVFAAADGRVVRVSAREGDSVEAGQVLAELEVAGHPAQLSSPQRGVVLARHIEVGDYALAASHGAPAPLFELADPTKTELRVEVEESDAASLASNLPVTIAAIGSPPRTARGQIKRISARLERRSIGADDARVRADGMVRVAAVSWTGEPVRWPIGTRAEAVIEVRRRDAAARVPRSALAVRDGRTIVERPSLFFARETAVEVIAADDAYAEIRGLAPGTEIIIHAR